MTEHKSFKRLVRARMERTGESYTAARAALLGAEEPTGPPGESGESGSSGAPGASGASGAPGAPGAPSLRLKTSDENIRRRTGHGWEEWFAMLDEWGAPERSHREIARWLAEQQGTVPLAWNVQAVVGGYELARGLREVGEKEDGFAITASRTIDVPVERLYDAFVDESARGRWLPGAELSERTATRPKSARFDWGDGTTRVHVTFLARDGAKSSVALEHRRLPDAGEAARSKAYWRERLIALKELLER